MMKLLLLICSAYAMDSRQALQEISEIIRKYEGQSRHYSRFKLRRRHKAQLNNKLHNSQQKPQPQSKAQKQKQPRTTYLRGSTSSRGYTTFVNRSGKEGFTNYPSLRKK